MAIRSAPLILILCAPLIFGAETTTSVGVLGTEMDIGYDVAYTTRGYCENDDIGYYCDNWCRTLKTCLGHEEAFSAEPCENINRKTRFCVGRTCTELPDENNDECLKETFQCTSLGVFPDPYDCTTYFTCNQTDLFPPTKYKCPTNHVYASRLERCVESSGYQCETFDCAGQSHKFVAFLENPKYFGYCEVPILLFKCDDGYYFDESKNDCVKGTGPPSSMQKKLM